MVHCSFPDSIEMLTVWFCSSVTTISLTGRQKLKSVSIEGCNKLLEREWGGENISGMLHHVWIIGWTNLKSIIELNNLVHLTELIVKDCESLESFPYNELSSLTSLKSLVIMNCPNMDACFPCGVWPHKLCRLMIGKLKKPMSEWGSQNFPTSLVELWLFGGDDGVTSCSHFSHFLPSSLTYLHLNKFEKLESVSMGLQHLQTFSFKDCPNLKKVSHPQHLTSLQHLSFIKCANMMDLPEVQLPSLLSLTIWRCPNLEERCSEKGSYWPLISHIPCIDIQSAV